MKRKSRTENRYFTRVRELNLLTSAPLFGLLGARPMNSAISSTRNKSIFLWVDSGGKIPR